jgi:hypothetical protein
MLDASDARAREIELAGFFLHAAGHAFVHLRMLGGPDVEQLCAGVEPNGWYPSARFAALLGAVQKRFRDVDPVLEQLGVQMMSDWYSLGPGKGAVKTGVEFLKFQTSSQGYRSVVKGPDSAIGQFALDTLDEAAGTARVRSTTPFARSMELGVLLGGMRAPGDLTYVDVDNKADASVFEIRFH